MSSTIFVLSFVPTSISPILNSVSILKFRCLFEGLNQAFESVARDQRAILEDKACQWADNISFVEPGLYGDSIISIAIDGEDRVFHEGMRDGADEFRGDGESLVLHILKINKYIKKYKPLKYKQ